MKSVLIILSKNNQSDMTVNESIAALMLFASFDINISVLFKEAALSLLANLSPSNDELKSFLKPANKMVESFEFYDIENLYVLEKDQQHPLVKHSQQQLQAAKISPEFMAQFDHIIYW